MPGDSREVANNRGSFTLCHSSSGHVERELLQMLLAVLAGFDVAGMLLDIQAELQAAHRHVWPQLQQEDMPPQQLHVRLVSTVHDPLECWLLLT